MLLYDRKRKKLRNSATVWLPIKSLASVLQPLIIGTLRQLVEEYECMGSFPFKIHVHVYTLNLLYSMQCQFAIGISTRAEHLKLIRHRWSLFKISFFLADGKGNGVMQRRAHPSFNSFCMIWAKLFSKQPLKRWTAWRVARLRHSQCWLTPFHWETSETSTVVSTGWGVTNPHALQCTSILEYWLSYRMTSQLFKWGTGCWGAAFHPVTKHWILFPSTMPPLSRALCSQHYTCSVGGNPRVLFLRHDHQVIFFFFAFDWKDWKAKLNSLIYILSIFAIYCVNLFFMVF